MRNPSNITAAIFMTAATLLVCLLGVRSEISMAQKAPASHAAARDHVSIWASD